jgi:hypothetical protein
VKDFADFGATALLTDVCPAIEAEAATITAETTRNDTRIQHPPE